MRLPNVAIAPPSDNCGCRCEPWIMTASYTTHHCGDESCAICLKFLTGHSPLAPHSLHMSFGNPLPFPRPPSPQLGVAIFIPWACLCSCFWVFHHPWTCPCPWHLFQHLSAFPWSFLCSCLWCGRCPWGLPHLCISSIIQLSIHRACAPWRCCLLICYHLLSLSLAHSLSHYQTGRQTSHRLGTSRSRTDNFVSWLSSSFDTWAYSSANGSRPRTCSKTTTLLEWKVSQESL